MLESLFNKVADLETPTQTFLRTALYRTRMVAVSVSIQNIYRSSRPEIFCKKGVLRNFAKFTGKQLHQSLFFNKVAGLRPTTLLKKRPWHRCFPVKFLRTPFLTKHLRWLLLTLEHSEQT